MKQGQLDVNALKHANFAEEIIKLFVLKSLSTLTEPMKFWKEMLPEPLHSILTTPMLWRPIKAQIVQATFITKIRSTGEVAATRLPVETILTHVCKNNSTLELQAGRNLRSKMPHVLICRQHILNFFFIYRQAFPQQTY